MAKLFKLTTAKSVLNSQLEPFTKLLPPPPPSTQAQTHPMRRRQCTAAATQLAFPDPPRHSHRLSSRNPLRQVAAAWAELVAAHRTLRDAPLATPTTKTASMISASIRTRCFAQFSRLEFLYEL